MRPTVVLLRQIPRITLFTRRNCPLCDEAKEVVDKVKQRRPFDYHEVNVMGRGQKKWRSLYEFETPVVCGLATPSYLHYPSNVCYRFTSMPLKKALQFSKRQRKLSSYGIASRSRSLKKQWTRLCNPPHKSLLPIIDNCLIRPSDYRLFSGATPPVQAAWH